MRIISKHFFFLRKANALPTDDNGYRVFVVPSRLPIIQYSNRKNDDDPTVSLFDEQ